MSCNQCRDLAALLGFLRAELQTIHEQVADLVDDHIIPTSDSALWWDVCALYEHTLRASAIAEARLARTLGQSTPEQEARARGLVPIGADQGGAAAVEGVATGEVEG